MTPRLTGALALAALMASPALAADYAFTVTNSTPSELVAVHVRDGQVTGFKHVPANGEREFTITLPDGVCITQLQFVFTDIEPLAMPGYDACNSGGIDLSI
jgi:hypothetical protein